MAEDVAKSSGNTGKSGAKRAASPTKTLLLQQVREQAQQIDELTALVQRKEQELVAFSKQSARVDDLVYKLQETELAMQSAAAQVKARNRMVEDLRNQLRQQEQNMTSAAYQTQLIDDLTTRLQEVEIKLAAASLQGKHVVAQNIVKTHMVAGMALGLLPAPLFDIAALSGVQLNLLRSLCKHYRVAFDEQLGKGIVSALVGGSLPVLTVLGLSSVAKLIPGIGTVGGGISMTVSAGSTLYAAGQVFIRHFEAGGTLQNFESKHWKLFFKEKISEGKAFVRHGMHAE